MSLIQLNLINHSRIIIFYVYSRAREDLRAANLRINQMLADYGDVVPRREFDMIETSFRVSCNTV